MQNPPFPRLNLFCHTTRNFSAPMLSCIRHSKFIEKQHLSFYLPGGGVSLLNGVVTAAMWMGMPTRGERVDCTFL